MLRLVDHVAEEQYISRLSNVIKGREIHICEIPTPAKKYGLNCSLFALMTSIHSHIFRIFFLSDSVCWRVYCLWSLLLPSKIWANICRRLWWLLTIHPLSVSLYLIINCHCLGPTLPNVITILGFKENNLSVGFSFISAYYAYLMPDAKNEVNSRYSTSTIIFTMSLIFFSRQIFNLSQGRDRNISHTPSSLIHKQNVGYCFIEQRVVWGAETHRRCRWRSIKCRIFPVNCSAARCR